jgi:hypothetical protein
MPRFDGTGPLGFGPGTGWGLGPCGGGMTWRGFARRSLGTGGGWGRGFGRDQRWGRFWRFWGLQPYQSPITEKEEMEILKEEAEALEDELKTVKERLTELRAKK